METAASYEARFAPSSYPTISQIVLEFQSEAILITIGAIPEKLWMAARNSIPCENAI